MMQLQKKSMVFVGRPAPQLRLPTLSDGMFSLSRLQGSPVLVSFLRHAGCLFSRNHLVQMIKYQDEISKLGGHVLLVVHDEAEMVRSKMMHDLDVRFSVLIDLQKLEYRRWGLGRTTYGKSIFSPGLIFRFVRLLLKGERFMGFGNDILQQGGDFVIAHDGTVSYAHRMKHSADRPPISVLIDEMAMAAAKEPVLKRDKDPESLQYDSEIFV